MIEIWIRKYQKSLKRRLKFCMIEIVQIQILMEWKFQLSKFENQNFDRASRAWSKFEIVEIS